MKKTTFVRKGASLQKQLPLGTKPSVHNGQLLVSSGLHDLDGIIGGGFPLGSLVLIEEDRFSEYCQHLMRYFLSEGMTNRHSIACGLFNQIQYSAGVSSLSSGSGNGGHGTEVLSSLHPSLSSYFAFNYSRYKAELEEKEQEKDQSLTNSLNSSTSSNATSKLSTPSESSQNSEISTTTSTTNTPNSIMDRLNRKIGATSFSSSTSVTATSHTQPSTTQDSTNSELKIAWRYQDYVEQQMKLKQQRSSTSASASSGEKSGVVGTVLCSEYDLSKTMQPEIIKANLDGLHVLFEKDEIFDEKIGVFYDELLRKIAKIISASKTHYTNAANTSNEISSRAVVRIGLQSLGSLFYSGDDSKTTQFRYMLKFLSQLKALLRSSLSVCVCTIPKASINSVSPSLLNELEQLSDLSLSIDSFTGAGLDVSEWEFKEYSGLFYIKKLFKMNSLTYNFTPETLNYAFKLKKRKMYIEKLHLPPEETREASNPDRPKFKASNEVERHKLQVERVIKSIPSMNSASDSSNLATSSDDHVFGCASQSSVSGNNPLDF
ncbi:hypothetical protein C9374_010619 [Naegleria lovaniensis]|uniref:Elongator complex protein 4 n=1 Tax=Naegleria lovaniensis TaxID=51637 RepID=A0AA88KDC9_NAELO|nr:uncharacterized protein C9374_010619 [Naegleria lovaniensis]KAG2374600.1 hypothetical protein C9374_010619 [Naegleria lovaniensis]